MTQELVTNGQRLLMIARRQPQPIGQLQPNQLAWCRAKWPWFEHNRVQRLADHERASAAYAIAERIDEARTRMEATV